MPTTTAFHCPVCQKPLMAETARYFCHRGHSFDIASEGFVNLLMPGHTGRGTPGDSIPMLQSRKAFLQQGYYQRFSDQLNAIVAEELSLPQRRQISILDAGCGEGYYTWRLQQSLSSLMPKTAVHIYGTDVARPAIRYAAKRGDGVRFAVASSFHLPFLPGSLDGLVCIFSPRHEQEFHRVLNARGTLIVASPGPRHLFHVKSLMYTEPESIGERGTVTEGFTLHSRESVNYTIHLKSTEDLQNLVNMTPYSRHIDARTRERLASVTDFETEVDINIMIYHKA